MHAKYGHKQEVFLRILGELEFVEASDEVHHFLIKQIAHNAFFRETNYENSNQRIVIRKLVKNRRKMTLYLKPYVHRM